MSDESEDKINNHLYRNTLNIEKLGVRLTFLQLVSGVIFIIIAIWGLSTFVSTKQNKEDNTDRTVSELKHSMETMKEELKLYINSSVSSRVDSTNAKLDKFSQFLNHKIDLQNDQIRYINQKCDRLQFYTERRRYPGDPAPVTISKIK
jgi:Na+-transporting methylmalonyl-CoA/oxaloacetate decarboxylase gamma subunit